MSKGQKSVILGTKM